MPNVELSILIANQAVVSGSARASGRALARNPASSSSFPGLACSVTSSPTVTMCCLLLASGGSPPYRRPAVPGLETHLPGLSWMRSEALGGSRRRPQQEGLGRATRVFRPEEWVDPSRAHPLRPAL